MRSSIINSRPWAGHLLVFSSAFLVFAFLGELAYRHSPPAMAWRGEVPGLGLGDGKIVFETADDHNATYETLYYGLGEVGDHARDADVLLLGDSRVLFAFREGPVRAFSIRSGLKVFNLCFPAGDGMGMALETIRRLDLRPKVVVVDRQGFFGQGLGPYAEETVKEGPWRAWSSVLEQRISLLVRGTFHRWIPRFSIGDNYSPKPYVVVQDGRDGCLMDENFPDIRLPFHPRNRMVEWDESLLERQKALEFAKVMAERGAWVVLTDIPFGVDSFAEARRSAQGIFRRLQVPDNLRPFRRSSGLASLIGADYVAPPMKTVETYDGSHLTRASADLFAERFFKEFGALKRVRAPGPSAAPPGRR